MADKNKLRKNGGSGTFAGNALRSIVGVAPELLNLVGTVTGMDGLNKLGDAIRKSDLPTKDKEFVLAEIQKDIAVDQELTKRWEADMHSDSWLSKNVRPLVLLYLVLCTTIVMILDSASVLVVKEHWVSLMTSLLLTTIGAYFGLREAGKFVNKKYK